jgi:hypothetical protein
MPIAATSAPPIVNVAANKSAATPATPATMRLALDR